MKYPQLVSTRAVNAISDWLVSRLEQLGVEAPQIYTRLLLSLLQSSFQINDPIEFSNLETFFANRKGGNRRYLPCDTDTLKKLNAVQCLRDIVSTEQEIATIENLVDELCEKLKDIEQQTAEIEDEHKLLLATLTTVPNGEHVTSHHSQQHTQQQHHHCYAHNNHIHFNKQHHSKEDYELELDIETDPKKRYFRAFPALSKEMEDSFGVWRRNAKSLTWPVERSNLSLSSSSSSSTISNSFSSAAPIGKTSEELEQQKQIGRGVGSSANLSNQSDSNIVVVAEATPAEVKRKSKRRRTQALSKGKTLPITRKNSPGNAVAVVPRQHRNSTPTYWDTDFEGCWEMGRDLIKEFRLKQNRQNRNRSTSEGEAYAMMSAGGVIATPVEHKMDLEERPTQDSDNTALPQMSLDNAAKMAEQTITKNRLMTSSPLLQLAVDISFCCDDGDDGVDEADGDETLASVSELAIDIPLNEASTPRHYELFGSADEPIDEEDIRRMEQFKAKFNSNVEALWHDAEQQKRVEPTVDVLLLSASSSLQTSIPNAVHFRDELKNFWNSYYSHHLDFKTIDDPTPQLGGTDSGNKSLTSSGTMRNIDNTNNTSDYYSMPSDLNKLHTTPGRRCFEDMPVGVFLQPNSIWSGNSETSAADTDESFYYKVWNGSNGLQHYNMDVEGKIRQEKKKITSNSGGDKNSSKPDDSGSVVFNLPTYNVTSKWSEGINAGPHSQQQLLRQKSGNHQMANVDCTDSTSGTSTSCTHSSSAVSFNWHTPFVGGQNLQPDLQSWSASNPMSLTEMYGNIGGAVGGAGVVGGVTSAAHVVDTTVAGFGSNVSLSNHCSNSSGFVEYARIKIVHQESGVDGSGGGQQRIHSQSQPIKDRYPEGENLLTSEHTHFRPIKSFSDGHSFNISGALDIIDYDRSLSGYLYLEEEKYLEYTRNDSFMAEDEVNAHSAGVSAAPLYASSNCEAAQARHGGSKKQKSEFIIRFRLRNCDIGCQTDDNEIGMLLTASRRLQFETTQHPLCLLFAEGTPSLTATGLACSNAIEALNKAVAVAAKAAAMGGGTHWQPQLPTINSYRQTSMWPQDEDTGYDEVDFCSGAIEDGTPHWSTVGRRQSQQYSNAYDNNNGINNIANCCNNNASTRRAQHAASSHSLWGMCAACNNSSGSSESSELKSVPANRLLRDELQIEADEIMSDLKDMQDLYIGRTAVGRGETAETSSDSNTDECDADDEDNFATERENNVIADTTEVYRKLKEAVRRIKVAEFENDLNVMRTDEDKEYGCQKEQPETQVVLQKVNRLLANLLGPESAKKVTNYDEETAFGENIEAIKDEHQHFSGSLWFGGQDDANVWQATDDNNSSTSSTLLKPMELVRHFNNEQQADALQAEDDKFLAELSWEHGNLAEIWRQKTPPPTNCANNTWCYELDKAHNKINETESKLVNENTGAILVSDEVVSNNNNKMPNAIKNEHNPSKPLATDENFCKRMHQQLFNINASTALTVGAHKLKLGNRKRRHSASQNFFHQTAAISTANISKNNNNNNLNVADLNFNLKDQQQLIVSAPFDTNNFNNNNNNDEPLKMQNYINASRIAHALMAKKSNSSSLGGDAVVATTLPANLAAEAALALGSGVGGFGIGAEQQTIITCKYWTTLQPMPPTNFAADNSVVGGETTTLIADEAAMTFSCLIDKNASILRHVTMLSRPLTR